MSFYRNNDYFAFQEVEAIRADRDAWYERSYENRFYTPPEPEKPKPEEPMAMDPGVLESLRKDPIRFVKEVGPSIGKGRLLGCESIEQGELIALMMVTDNLSFLDVKQRFNVMGKTIDVRADYMRSELRRLGGSYEWTKTGDDGKEAAFRIVFKGESHDVHYTIEDAKREKLVKKDGAWETRPGDMLRARATSKAVRMYASEIISGFCTDEEMAALAGEITEVESEASGVGKSLKTETIAATAEAPKAEAPKESTKAQRDKIKELFVALAMTGEQQESVLKKRGANALRNLTHDGAADLLTALEGAHASRVAKVTGESKAQPDAQIETNNSPCGQVLIDKIRNELKSLQDKTLLQQVRDHLGRFGKKSVSDLTVSDAETLLRSLERKNLTAFFDSSLAAPAAEGDEKN